MGVGVGVRVGQAPKSSATMRHAHSLPPTHNIRNICVRNFEEHSGFLKKTSRKTTSGFFIVFVLLLSTGISVGRPIGTSHRGMGTKQQQYPQMGCTVAI